MDAHLIIKIIHMSTLIPMILALLGRGFSLWYRPQGDNPNPKGRIVWVALQHLSFTVFLLSGMVLLVYKDFQVQAWFYAKLVLFFVMWSALSKAFRPDPQILLLQRRAGWTIATLAFVAVIILVSSKPVIF